MTKPTLTEVIETGLFGITGVVVELQESLPKIVAKGKSTLEPRLGIAKFVGQFAVTRFESEFQKRADAAIGQITDLVSLLLGQLKDEGPYESNLGSMGDSVSTEQDISANADVPTSIARVTTDAGHLPIVGYRTLSAQQIIARLDSLNQSELDEIEQYESENRDRASILRSIAAKRARL